MQWSFELIKSMIEKAERDGEDEAVLSSPREAELFRLAINNNRRSKRIGQTLTTEVKNNTVRILKRPEIKRKNKEDKSSNVENLP